MIQLILSSTPAVIFAFETSDFFGVIIKSMLKLRTCLLVFFIIGFIAA